MDTTVQDKPTLLDPKRLVATVLEKHGVHLGSDDPALILVTINQLVLQEALDQLQKSMTASISQANTSVDAIKSHAARELGIAVRTAAQAIRQEIQNDINAAKLDSEDLIVKLQAANAHVNVNRWIAAGIVAGAVILVFGILLGRLL